MTTAQQTSTADWAARGYESEEEFQLYLDFEAMCKHYGVIKAAEKGA